jgi:hypothetical protein
VIRSLPKQSACICGPRHGHVQKQKPEEAPTCTRMDVGMMAFIARGMCHVARSCYYMSCRVPYGNWHNIKLTTAHRRCTATATAHRDKYYALRTTWPGRWPQPLHAARSMQHRPATSDQPTSRPADLGDRLKSDCHYHPLPQHHHALPRITTYYHPLPRTTTSITHPLPRTTTHYQKSKHHRIKSDPQRTSARPGSRHHFMYNESL